MGPKKINVVHIRLGATAVGSTEADEFAVKVGVDFMQRLGLKTVTRRCDNEPAMLGLRRAIQDARPEKTIPSEGKLKGSQSMGAVETAIR